MKKLIFMIAAASCVTGCAGVNPNAVKVECINGTAYYGNSNQIRTEQKYTDKGINITKEGAGTKYYYHKDVPMLIEEQYWTGFDNEIKIEKAKISHQRVYILDPDKIAYGKTYKEFMAENQAAYDRICKSPVPISELLNKFAGVKAKTFEGHAYAPATDGGLSKFHMSEGDRDYDKEAGFQAILEKHIPGYDSSLITEKHHDGKPMHGTVYDGKVADPIAAIQAFVDNPEKQASLDKDLAEYFGNSAGKRAATSDIAKRQAGIDKRRTEWQWKYNVWQGKNEEIKRQYGQSTTKTVPYDVLKTENDAIEKEQAALDAERKAIK